MNTAEKLVSVYLRLNGFLILNGFTHLSSEGHTKESDLLAFRCPGSYEEVNGKTLEVDKDFLTKCQPDKDKPIPLIVEVKAGNETLNFDDEKVEYARKFFGDYGKEMIKLEVSRNYSEPKYEERDKCDKCINIGISYISNKICKIIKKRDKTCCGHKSGSWHLTGGFLSDLTYLKRVENPKNE